jgi:hypothetical protein
MELHESEWKAVRVRVVLRVGRHALLPQLSGPGVNGNPSLKFCPMFAKAASGGSVAGLRFRTIGPPSRPLGGWRLSHVPEKSILPLGRRGGGASRSSLPSLVRGVSCRTKEGH